MCNRASAELLPPRARALPMRAALHARPERSGAERSRAAVNPDNARSADVSGVRASCMPAERSRVYTYGIFFFNPTFARLVRWLISIDVDRRSSRQLVNLFPVSLQLILRSTVCTRSVCMYTSAGFKIRVPLVRRARISRLILTNVDGYRRLFRL